MFLYSTSSAPVKVTKKARCELYYCHASEFMETFNSQIYRQQIRSQAAATAFMLITSSPGPLTIIYVCATEGIKGNKLPENML